MVSWLTFIYVNQWNVLTPCPLTGWMTRLLPPPLPAGLPLPAPPFESMTMVRVEPLPPRPDPGGRPLPRPRPAPRVGDDCTGRWGGPWRIP